LRLEAGGQSASEGFAELLQRLGRQFLDEEFEQQILRRHFKCSSSLFVPAMDQTRG
jgi:hypothetical protein